MLNEKKLGILKFYPTCAQIIFLFFSKFINLLFFYKKNSNFSFNYY